MGVIAAGRIGLAVLERMKPFNVGLHYFIDRLPETVEKELGLTYRPTPPRPSRRRAMSFDLHAADASATEEMFKQDESSKYATEHGHVLRPRRGPAPRPCPPGLSAAAAAMASPRTRTSATAAAKGRAPVATSAEYSPEAVTERGVEHEPGLQQARRVAIQMGEQRRPG